MGFKSMYFYVFSREIFFVLQGKMSSEGVQYISLTLKVLERRRIVSREGGDVNVRRFEIS